MAEVTSLRDTLGEREEQVKRLQAQIGGLRLDVSQAQHVDDLRQRALQDSTVSDDGNTYSVLFS